MGQPKQKSNTNKTVRTAPLEVAQNAQSITLSPKTLDGSAIDDSLLAKELGFTGVVDRSKEVFRVSRDSATYEVSIISDIKLEDYRKITPVDDWILLKKWAETMRGKTVVFINPTMEGGGVAMLRPPMVHILKQLGIDAHWYVMEGQVGDNGANPFIFTKLMHNILQRQALPDQRITDDGKAIHQQWNAENAKVLTAQAPIRNADIVVIDDPQPAPLINYIKDINPSVKIVWRNHIDTNGDLMADPSTPQGEISSYLLDVCGVSKADAVITHPVAAFVHPKLWGKTFFAPATIEPHDDLNRELTPQEITEGIEFINAEIQAKNTTLDDQDKQSLIDTNRCRIGLVARFDESKGMDKAMAMGVRVRQIMRKAGVPENKLPQVIILGNGSVDDPSGEPMYQKMLSIRREQYPDDKEDIILMRLRHNYKAMNALMYPASNYDDAKTPALVAMQTSEAEGCETRISDWIRHGVPVVVSNRGGMSLQIIEGESGCVIDFDKPGYDIEKGAEFISRLMTDRELYASMRKSTQAAADNFNNREFTTTANVTRWLRVFHHVFAGTKADKTWKISELIKD